MWNKIKSLFSNDSASNIREFAVDNVDDEFKNVPYTLDSCPSCGFEFDSIPTRKKKCPKCSANIIVKKSHSLNQKILLTEKAAVQLEANQSKIYFLNKWIRKLDQYGISEQEYYNRHKKACDQKEFNITHSDFIWSMFNKLISEIQEPHTLQMLYFDMAWILNEDGKDFYKVLRESKKWELLKLRSNGLKLGLNKVEILASKNSCEACKKQDGKIFTIDKALKDMPLPCKECKNTNYDNFCRCMYLPVLK